MAELALQTVDQNGTTPTYVAAASGGDSFPNDQKTFLHAKNGYTDTQTVTIAKASASVRADTHGDIPLSDIAIAIAASGEAWIQAPHGSFNQGGKAQVSYSGVSSLTVAAVRLAKV